MPDLRDYKRARRVEHGDWYHMDPATGVCVCGEEVILRDPLDNPCDCGLCYNMSGQEVVPSWQCYGGKEGVGEPIDEE